VVVAAEAGLEFVALSRAVWEHPGGPGAAVAEASALLAAVGENAA
jgi:thiamine-phosphate pyrophosphorylase